MRRWDRLVERYVEEYRARGIGEPSVAHAAFRLNRWGRWLKEQRHRVVIEEIDAPLITRRVVMQTGRDVGDGGMGHRVGPKRRGSFR